MTEIFLSIHIFCLVFMTISLVAMHVVKKYTALVSAYVMQSLCLIFLLGLELYQHFSFGLMAIIVVSFVIKVIAVPIAFSRIIKQTRLNLLHNTYLSIPLTLCALFLLLSFARSDILSPVTALLPVPLEIRTMLLGNFFMAIFLIINRKGALSQVLGVLSVENAIFVIGIFLQIKQLLSLELGILFNLLFWVIASSMFVRMLYQKFGSFDISSLNQLKK